MLSYFSPKVITMAHSTEGQQVVDLEKGSEEVTLSKAKFFTGEIIFFAQSLSASLVFVGITKSTIDEILFFCMYQRF